MFIMFYNKNLFLFENKCTVFTSPRQSLHPRPSCHQGRASLLFDNQLDIHNWYKHHEINSMTVVLKPAPVFRNPDPEDYFRDDLVSSLTSYSTPLPVSVLPNPAFSPVFLLNLVSSGTDYQRLDELLITCMHTVHSLMLLMSVLI